MFIWATRVYTLWVESWDSLTSIPSFWIAQSAGRDLPVVVGAAGIVVAAASNNVAKGFYAYCFSDRKTGSSSLALLLSLGLAGLVPLLWLLR